MNYKNLTKAGFFCALITIATMLIKIPVPQTQGYINFGDVAIFLSALFIANPYCALAAALGSALADILLGAGIYIIPTFIIKGMMGFVASNYIYQSTSNKKIAIGLILPGVIMTLGYFTFEIFIYGPLIALASLPFNCIQAVAAVIAGFIFIPFVKHINLSSHI